MRLIPLGTASANKNPTRAFSSYLFEAGNLQFLVDVGSWRVREYTGIDYRRLRYVFLSHSHGDHTWHIGTLVKRYVRAWERVGTKPPAKLEVFFGCHPLTPPYLFALVGFQLLPNFTKIFKYVRFHPILRRGLARPRTILAFRDAHGLDAFRARAARADHPGGAVGYSFEVLEGGNGSVRPGGFWKPLKVTIVPDTSGVFPPVVELARGSDYLFHDCTFPRCYVEYFRRNCGRFLKMTHSCPEEAGATAREAGARALGAIHYWDERFPDKEKMKRSISGEFPGRVILTNDLEPVELD
ncbi:MAG: MBL fold metallo-hydrolase [Promethearchaeota archaeon]